MEKYESCSVDARQDFFLSSFCVLQLSKVIIQETRHCVLSAAPTERIPISYINRCCTPFLIYRAPLIFLLIFSIKRLMEKNRGKNFKQYRLLSYLIIEILFYFKLRSYYIFTPSLYIFFFFHHLLRRWTGNLLFFSSFLSSRSPISITNARSLTSVSTYIYIYICPFLLRTLHKYTYTHPLDQKANKYKEILFQLNRISYLKRKENKPWMIRNMQVYLKSFQQFSKIK